MKFVDIRIGSWFEFESKLFHKASRYTALLDGVDEPIEFEEEDEVDAVRVVLQVWVGDE